MTVLLFHPNRRELGGQKGKATTTYPQPNNSAGKQQWHNGVSESGVGSGIIFKIDTDQQKSCPVAVVIPT